MPLNDVITRFATGTYVVTRAVDGVYLDGEYVLPSSTSDVTASAVDEAADSITALTHGLATGDGPFRMIGATLPEGVSDAVPYWVIVLDVDTLQLALSETDALAGTPFVDIIGDGAFDFELSSTRFQQIMSIQPAKGKDLDAIPEADRTSNMKLAFVAVPLLTREPGQEPDSVRYKGEDWTVVSSEQWEHWGATHWRCIIARDEVT